MKKIITLLLIFGTLFVFSGVASAYVKVKSYFRRNGTYVNSYYRTSPNSYKFDNWSTKGNYNLFTGKTGTKNFWGF